jgi:hypothetical protein
MINRIGRFTVRGRGSALELYRKMLRLYVAVIGGLLPLAPKSSCQTLRVCPCGLLRYPHEGAGKNRQKCIEI